MSISLGQIRAALEGAIPAVLATCDSEGEPNAVFLSQVHYVDENHVALSYQFFSKTRRNILNNPQGQITVMHPHTAQMFRMRLRYLRTESAGPLYERMKAHLEGIASHTGMAGVFRLLGSDIYEVSELEALTNPKLPEPPVLCNPLSALRRASEAIAACSDLGSLVETTLDVLVREYGVEHAMFLMADPCGERLYAVGSRGYAASGVGSEIALGDGVIGVCAQARTPIRISWVTQAYRYSRTMRDVTVQDGQGNSLRTEIPYPGLRDPQSQLGVPMVRAGHLVGVLFVESAKELNFTYDHEDAFMALAAQVAASVDALHEREAVADAKSDPAPASVHEEPQGAALQVRCYGGSNSIFFGDQYIIKGVAGAILWRLLQDYQNHGRTEFSNREIRLDPSIRLPDVVDNLEARLILLRRRLAEQDCGVSLHKGGRGRLSLQVRHPLELAEIRAD